MQVERSGWPVTCMSCVGHRAHRPMTGPTGYLRRKAPTMRTLVHHVPGARFALLALALWCGVVKAQQRGGVVLPDTNALPALTIEEWKTLPKGYRFPGHVDLSPWFPPAGDQGRQFSCVPWAICYGLMTYRRDRLDRHTYRHTDAVDSTRTFSPAYLYNLIMSIDRGNYRSRPVDACTAGTDIERLLEFVMIGGCATLKEVPYDTTLSSCLLSPGYLTMIEAIQYHVPPAQDLGPFDPVQWRYHLAEGRPIVAGVVATTGLVRGGIDAKGEREFTWSYVPNDRILFGHAVVCTGYDLNDSTFTFLNSWGLQWGYHGYFKATMGQMRNYCYAGYVMNTDSAATWAQVPGEPASDHAESGAKVHEDLAPGEYRQINGRKVKLASLGRHERSAVVEVFNATNDSLVRTVTMRADQPYVIYDGHERVELTVERRGTVGRILHRSVPFTMVTSGAEGDPYLQARNARIRRVEEMLPK